MIEVLFVIMILSVFVFLLLTIKLTNKIKALSVVSEQVPQGYNKFLEASREDAFLYIEEVQKVISELKKSTEANDRTQARLSYSKLLNLLPDS